MRYLMAQHLKVNLLKSLCIKLFKGRIWFCEPLTVGHASHGYNEMSVVQDCGDVLLYVVWLSGHDHSFPCGLAFHGAKWGAIAHQCVRLNEVTHLIRKVILNRFLTWMPNRTQKKKRSTENDLYWNSKCWWCRRLWTCMLSNVMQNNNVGIHWKLC